MTHDRTDAQPVVLVAEDEALIRWGAADQLTREGFDVVEAANAAEALEIMRSRPEVRLLFTDIDMPGELDGMDLAAQVHERWPGVRLLVTSGRLALGDRDVPDAGMFLPKPYEGEKLSGAIKKLLAKDPS